MMAPEPLRSAMCIGGADDTSLALPSDNKLRMGQQRVLDQVHTIKRSKSKHVKSSSPSHSPTSPNPTLTTHTEFGSFKFSPSKTNGTFSRTNSTMSTGYNKAMNRSRTLSTKTMGGGYFSTSSTLEQHVNNSKYAQRSNGLKASRSDPALVPPFPPAPVPVKRATGQTLQNQQTLQTRVNRHSTYSVTNGTQMTNSQTRMVRSSSDHSHTDGKMGTMKISMADMEKLARNSAVNISDLTLKDAVEFLSKTEETYQQCGAYFIQQSTYRQESAKQEVSLLGGIPVLVTLLRSPNPDVSHAAAGSLRNLVFKDQNNKFEVQHCGGIAKALQLLKETDSTETQKQIAGLLWNLSSADELKEELTVTALPALTENVLVPFTSWSENTNNNNVHPDVFYHATGCLRNLSCAGKKERKAMRECRGLIDSLMSYVQSCVAEENPDDKSVENCACILHNLTFQLETESPECFEKFYPKSKRQSGKKSPTIGCFSPKSSKVQKEFLFDPKSMPEDSAASGVNWLCHPKAMQTYLSLMGTSQNGATLEACCGTLQNLTANKGQGSSAVSHILVQKLGALAHMPSLLKSSNQTLQKTAISLLGNMSRINSLQTSMAKQILPELTSLLSSGPREMGNSDEAIAAACKTAFNLMSSDTEVSKKVINPQLVSSLADLSENGSFPKGRKAASLLLYTMWNEKNLQGALKKMGMAKTLFVNDNTIAVHKSYQVIE